MTDQEALLSWLWVAWRKGQQAESLAEKVRKGMSVGDAVQEYERPFVACISTVIPNYYATYPTPL